MDNKDFESLREVYLKNLNLLYTLRNEINYVEEVILEQKNKLKNNCCHPANCIEYIPSDDPHGPSYYYKCSNCTNFINKYEIDR